MATDPIDAWRAASKNPPSELTFDRAVTRMFEDMFKMAFLHGWRCRQRVEDYPGAPADEDSAYVDWRAYGPGVTLPGGAEFRRTARLDYSWTGREFRPSQPS